MNEEIEKVEQEQTGSTESNEATAAAAAFGRNRGEIQPDPVVEVTEEEQLEPEPEVPAKFVGDLTAAEVAELLNEIPKYRKQIDNLAGTNGKLNAAIQKMQQETQRGEAVVVTDDDMQEIRDAYPELADMTKGALNKVLGRLNTRGTATQTPEDFIALAKKEALDVASSERVKTHRELLDGLHPGWEKIIGIPEVDSVAPDNEYRRWLTAQPAEYQAKINNSNNVFEIGSSIKAFNEAKDASSKKLQQNKQRLANAVQPTGQVAARTTISEKSAAEKAFKANRGR